jgi:hypothetical protein
MSNDESMILKHYTCEKSEYLDIDIPLIARKIDIKNMSNELVYDDRLHVLNILKQHIPLTKVIEHADGCRINLDGLTDDVIKKIHHVIKMKLRISHTNKI